MPPGSTLQELWPSGWRSFQPVRSLPLKSGRKPFSAAVAVRASGPRVTKAASTSRVFMFFIIRAVYVDPALPQADRDRPFYGLAWAAEYSHKPAAHATGDLILKARKD